ncbi:head maturation protease, ClpP-related [Jeotgalibaca porci]|uniref:head maturation protease, ClpP-related n=1 Tax=Jeotgalibaca porci TaxID=1868793 RepID=UPI003F91A2DE
MSDTHKIYIYGEIDSGNDRGTFSDLDLKEILDGLEPNQDITVHINSLGGRVDTGLAIYNLLKKWQGHVTTVVDGFCCSIASAILLAGDTVIASDNSLIMIHKPLISTHGNDTELMKQVGTLQKVEATLINIYQEKTGLSSDEIKAMLEAETWLDAEESLNLRFVDRIETTDTKAVASLYETVLAKLDVPKEIQEKLNQLKADLSQQEPPKPKKKGSKKLNKREILNAIAEVRSQHEGKDDKEIMLAHAGFDLLLNKLAEVEAKESQNKMTNLKQEDKEGEISFMENEKTQGFKIYNKSEKLEIGKIEEGLTLGGIIRAMATKQTDNPAIKAVIQNSVNGSVLVPESLSKTLLQAVRDKSVLANTQMKTVLMPTSKMTIAKQDNLPESAFKIESEKIVEGSMSFSPLVLSAKTIASTVRISSELMQDAQGVQEAITNALAESVAAEIDKQFITGDGIAPNPLGLKNYDIEKVTLPTEFSEMKNTGDISALVEKIRIANNEPNAVIYNAQVQGIIDRQTNQVGDPLRPFESYAGLEKHVSNKLDDIIVGDFSKLLMGVVKNVEIAMNDKDTRSWDHYEHSFRVVARVDVVCLDEAAFAVLSETAGA